MQTTSFIKKTYEVYDDSHYMLYFNEEESTVPAERDGAEGQKQYQYDTCLADGVKDGNGSLLPERGQFISAIIRSRYSQDQVEAITQNYLADPEGRKEEFDALQAWRAEAKRIVADFGL